MTKELEIEAKNLVTEQEFNALVTFFSIGENDFVTQINHYFESDDFALKKIGCALRIREKNDSFTLTLKQQVSEGVLETNEKLTKQDAEHMLRGGALTNGSVYDELISLQVDPTTLVYVGALETKRAKIPYKNGTLFFDKNRYFNDTDFEIEYEGNSLEHVSATFLQLLTEQQIPSREAKHKIARFFSARRT